MPDSHKLKETQEDPLALLLTEQLKKALVELEQNYSERQVRQLIDYLLLLHRWNRAYNLTAITEPKAMLVRHLLDSLALAPHVDGKCFLDVGTGAGLPGIPLAIAKPQQNFDLMDSKGKKVRFLFQVRAQLGLRNAKEIQQRVELAESAEGYDGILSRAYASLFDMIQSSQHLLAPGGYFYAMKGKVSKAEFNTIPKNYRVKTVQELAIPGLNEKRQLVVIEREG